MESASKMDVAGYLREMREKMEKTLREVAEAVNAAPDGSWVNGSEMEVRDLFARMRQEAYEKALQMRIDAAQAAFSPGASGDASASGEQGNRKQRHADGQRTR